MDHGERRSSVRPGLGPKHAGGSGPPLPGHSAPRSHSVREGESWKRVLEALRIRVALQELTKTANDGETGPANNPISVAWLRGQLAGIRTLPCSTLPSVGVTAAAVAGIFSKQAGAGQGELFLEFVPEAELSYDLTDFDQFQLFRSVHAILYIGSVTCHSSAARIETARRALMAKNEDRFAVQRCLLFGEALPPALSDAAQYSLVTMSDGSGCGADGGAAEDRLQSQLTVLVRELASSILRSFDAKYAQMARSDAQICSPRDIDKVFAASPPMRLAARSAGRLAKLAGDLYLLSGAYTDAVSTLVTAVEETKLHGDLLWYAGAQEALQIALVCQNDLSLSGLSSTGGGGGSSSSHPLPSPSMAQEKREVASLLWVALPDKLREVASLYLKADMAILSFEVHRAISALLDHAGSPSEAAMALCHGWSGHRQLNFSDKLYVLTVFVDRFESLGMARKRAFYLQSLASLLAAQRENVMALQVLMKTFSIYGISLDRPTQSVSSGGWGRLRMSILRKAASLAEAHPSAVLPVQYYCALLAHAADLEGEEQQRIYKFLRDTSRNGTSLGSINGLLPIFKSLVLDVNSPGLWRRERGRLRGLTSDSTFIYNPSVASRRPEEGRSIDQVAVAVGEPLSLCLILHNPYNFRLDLHQVTLLSETLPIMASEVDVSLKAHARDREVQLSVTPREGLGGQLRIHQLQASMFGIRFTFDLPPLAIAVIPTQPILRVTMDRAASHLSLLAGEERKIVLRVENVAIGVAAKIDGISISSRWSEEQTPTLNSVLFPPTGEPVKRITTVPPLLAPGKVLEIELLISGRRHWMGCDVSVNYGECPGDDGGQKDEPHPVYRRGASVKIVGSVKPALSIKSVSALPIQSTIGTDPLQLSPISEDEWCLVVVDLENPLSEQFVCSLECHGDVRRSFTLERLDKRRLILPMRRFLSPPSGPVQLTGAQLALLRKDCRMSDEQIEAINPLGYWVKKRLLESMRVTWPSGTFDLSDIVVAQETTALAYFLSPPLSIRLLPVDPRPIYPLNTPITVNVVLAADGGLRGSYLLRISPALYISDEEYNLNYEDFLVIDGSLSALGTYPPRNHQIALWAVSPCRVKLLVHVEMLNDHQSFSQPHPLVLDFSEA